MAQIAFVVGHTYVYWNSIITVLASAVAICLFLSLWLGKGKKCMAGILVIPLAIALSVILSRLVCWYFRPESYIGISEVLDIRVSGDMALSGAFAGCFLSAVLIRVIRLTDSLPELLDCLCLAGGTGIAVGRLASFFDVSDRGMILSAQIGFPWGCVISNPVNAVEEYRLATFMIQSLITAVIVLIFLAVYLLKREQFRDGDMTLLFLQCYGAAQVILDSTRYDSLYFRSNGFVSVVQVLGALAVALAVVVFAARMVYAGGWKKWYPALWIPQLACFGLAGYMEYHVQRHGNEALFAYSVMGAALAAIILSTLVSRRLAIRMENQRKEILFSVLTPEGDAVNA